MPNLDKRLNAWRDDLADRTLQNQVHSNRFVDAKIQQVITPTLSLRREADYTSPQNNELLFGDRVKVFDENKGWSWVQNCRDNYVGFCPSDGLSEVGNDATHQVSCLRTILFPQPDFKSCPVHYLSMTSTVAVVQTTDKYSQIESGEWIYSQHLAKTNEFESDFVATAQKFLGTPYLWGGNNSLGIDCSGLVQIALRRAGMDVLRDSDMQEETIGKEIHYDNDTSNLELGDLIFWKGHIGIYCANDMLLHANATDMMVSSKPFKDTCAHILKLENSPVTSVRRI